MTRHATPAALLIAAALPLAHADEAPALAPVLVTASRSQTPVQDLPLHTTVIDRAAIDRSPAQTLDQLLREVPGLNLPGVPFTASDPTGQQVKMRGVTTNSKVLVLLDGVPVHDPFYGTIQWFKLPLASIERVEVIRGGNASLWGNMAVLGVVNIVSRRPVDDRGEVRAAWGSRGTATLALSKDVRLGDALGLRLSADALQTDGYYTAYPENAAGYPGRGASADQLYNLQLAGTYTPSKDLQAHARVGLHRQDQTINGYTFGTNLQRSPDIAAGVTKTLADRSVLQANAWAQRVRFDKSNGAGCYLQVNGTSCNATTATAAVVQYAAQTDLNTYREQGASLLYAMRPAMLRERFGQLQVGADLRRLGGEDLAQVYNAPTGPSPADAALNRTVAGSGRQQFAGVFSQLKFNPLDPLELTLSARYDTWRNVDGFAQITKVSTGSVSGGPVADARRNSFNPGLAARWTVDEAWTARGAAYKSFRAPGLNNLYRSFSSSTSITLANPDLQPETLKGGELGLDFSQGGFKAGLTWFRVDIRNMIAASRVASIAAAPASVVDVCGSAAFGSAGSNCPATVSLNGNGQDGRSQGAELTAAWQPVAAWRLDAAWGYTRSVYTRTATGEPTGVQLAAVPWNVVTLGAQWQPADAWQLYGQVRYNGPMYLDVQHTVPQTGIFVVNASASYRVTRRLDVSLGIVNLFDQRYSDSAATSLSQRTLSQPRTATLGARWGFQ